MKSRGVTLLLVLGGLAVSGAGLNALVAPTWAAARARQPALRLDASVATAGQGVTLALLGGFRALVADASWLRMYVLWEKRDLPGTETMIRLVTAIDPRPLYFWVNGARILAYDLPVWRIRAAGGHEAVSEAEQLRIGQEHGRLGLRQLDAAMAFHPTSADLWIERANIQLHKVRDVLGAAESYRRAWEQPSAPYYAARMHGELLRRGGKKVEALAWLRQLHPLLPSNDDSAAAPLVLARIRELERELNVPAMQTYRPPASPPP